MLLLSLILPTLQQAGQGRAGHHIVVHLQGYAAAAGLPAPGAPQLR